MEAYFDGKTEGQLPGRFITFLMLILGIGSILVAEQILTGWVPLGERADILRSNINYVEWLTVIACLIFAAVMLRTGWGLYQRELSSLRWSQWASFATLIIGLIIVISVIIPTALKYILMLSNGLVPGVVAASVADTVPGIGWLAPVSLSIGSLLTQIGLLVLAIMALAVFLVFLLPILEDLKRVPIAQWIFDPPRRLIYGTLAALFIGLIFVWIAATFIVSEFPTEVSNIRHPEFHRLILGLGLLIPGMLVYRFVRRVEEVSDDLRRSMALTPGKALRFQLAKSPSAGAIIGFIAILLGFTMATDLFLLPTSVASILTNVSTKGVIAIGVTFLMISGEFDLSVGSILGVTAMSFVLFMTEGAPILGIVPPFTAAILALIVAFLLGAINGIVLILTRIPSFIVTLGTLLAFRAITLVAIAGGRVLRYKDYYREFPAFPISSWVLVVIALVGLAVLLFTAYRSLPVLWRRFQHHLSVRNSNGDFGTTTAILNGLFLSFVTIVLFLLAAWMVLVILFHLEHAGIIEVGFFDIINGRWEFTGAEVTRGIIEIAIPRNANFRMAIVWWLIFIVVFHIILTRTRYGNSVFATGGNPGAARAQGVIVDRVKVQNFVLVALLTGIAAIYEVARSPGIDPLKGNGWELEVIAMTVIGGALLSGGYGSIVGTLLGALIFGMLQTGLVLVGIESRLFSGTIGVIIIVAVVLNTAVRGRQE